MKRIIGFLLDIIFFVSFICVFLLGGIFIVYQRENDISILNTFLQTDLIRTMLIVYGGYMLLHLLYFWALPTMLKQSLGQRLAGTSFQSEKKINLWRVFLKTIVGSFWDVALFPYTLFVAIKKRPLISTRLSGISVQKSVGKPSKALYITTAIFTIYLIVALGAGTYIYKTGVNTLMERYTNYEKQVTDLIAKLAYQDASAALEKYKQYKGEDNNHSYFNCIIQANLSTELTGLELCKKALEANSSSTERVKVIIGQQAKIYAANDDFKNAEIIYARLWNDFQDRSLDMKNYVVVLSELGKTKDATEKLNEIAKQLPTDDVLILSDLGNLYERIGNIDVAFQKYQSALLLATGSDDQAMAGELNYDIGVIYYNKGKYTEATASFEQAKLLNKDFAEPVDSYIILISKLKNSVTK